MRYPKNIILHIHIYFHIYNIYFRRCLRFSISQHPKSQRTGDSLRVNLLPYEKEGWTQRYIAVRTCQNESMQGSTSDFHRMSFTQFVQHFGIFSYMNKNIFTCKIDDIYECISPKYDLHKSYWFLFQPDKYI